MTPSDLNKECKLSSADCSAFDSSNQYIINIRHAVNRHMTTFELPNGAGDICCDNADGEDSQDTTSKQGKLALRSIRRIIRKKTQCGKCLGSERTPSDMVSTIMTGGISCMVNKRRTQWGEN